MARTPNPPDPIESLPPETQRAVARAMAVQTDEFALVNQLMGQAQMAHAVSRFTNVAFLTKLVIVKEQKLYRAFLKIPNGLGKFSEPEDENQGNQRPSEAKSQTVSEKSQTVWENPPHTWEGFCECLGFSATKIDEDIANLKVFGEEALERLSRVGVGYRELRKMRRLPDDTRQTILEKAETAEKDDLVQMVDDAVARTEKLWQENANLKADLRARDQVLEEKGRRLDVALADAVKAKRITAQLPPDDRLKKIQGETNDAFFAALAYVRQLGVCLDTLLEHAHESLGGDYEMGEFAAGLLCQLRTTLEIIQHRHSLKSAPDGQRPRLPGADDDITHDPQIRATMRESWEAASPEQRRLHAKLYAQYGLTDDQADA